MAEMLIEAERIVPGVPAPRSARSGGPAGDLNAVAPGHVLVRDGVIAVVGEGPPPRPADVRLDGGVLVPGFVDLQVNGYFGAELEAARADEWRMVATRLPETGTTAFMPTFITAPVPQLAHALRQAARLASERADTGPAGPRRPGPQRAGHAAGARVLGVHLEGPFISPLRAGAHRKDWMTDPAPGAISELLDAGGGILKIVTLAPELPGALAAITRLARAGVVVSVGHTDAIASQVAAAADAGARMVTHLFNAQRPLHHREPGVPGQALSDSAVDQRADRGLPSRRTAGLRARLHGRAGADLPGHGRGGVRRDAAGDVSAGRRADRAARRGRDAADPAGRHAGGLGAADGRGRGEHGPRRRWAARRGRGRDPDTRGPHRPAELGRIAPGAAADLTWLGDGLRARATWVAGELVYSR